MSRLFPRALATLACAMLLPMLAACGSSGGDGDVAGSNTLEVLITSDVQSLDPGITYSSLDLNILSATQRTLYTYRPDDPANIAPDLAAGPPQVTNGGKRLTVKLRRGVRFSPPVDREVTSKDVKYAIERGFNANLANPYASLYYGSLVGADDADGGPIEGLKTPDRYTLVFELTQPTASLVAQATILPLSAPVPPEVAKEQDANATPTYANYVASTGPYMFAADRGGKVLGKGYVPGRRIRLVRNPNWDPETDERPAHVDEIQFAIGGSGSVIGRQVLEGDHKILGETPSAPLVKRAYQEHRDQIIFAPGSGSRYIALNTAIPPFDNPDLRKAVAAALDRERMRLVRGGEVVGDIANHFLYPGMLGFEIGGAYEGTTVDFLSDPKGNMAVARGYMEAAGYPSGEYTGDEKVLVIGLAGAPDDKDAQIVDQALRDLGFETELKIVDGSVYYSRFCALPKARVHVCPNVGWIRDFADPQTVLDLAFSGDYIFPENNPNWSQFDDPVVNRMIRKARVTVGEDARAEAWGAIDRRITENAPAIPWLWDKQPNVFSADVTCEPQLWNQGHCDLAYSSLES
jgi:peptide/nickel transport system substrate-binding protein